MVWFSSLLSKMWRPHGVDVYVRWVVTENVLQSDDFYVYSLKSWSRLVLVQIIDRIEFHVYGSDDKLEGLGF